MSYLPLADISVNMTVIFITGLIAGIIGGVFGTLTNAVIVPILTLLGLPVSVSVSASLGQGFGRSSLALFTGDERPAFRRAGITAGIIGLPGVYAGYELHLSLAGIPWGKAAILLCYSVVILSAAVAVFRQWGFFNRNHYYDTAPFPPFGLNWRFPLAIPGEPGLRHVTISRVLLTGLLLGTCTGFLGIAAGVLGIPLFMYIMGLTPEKAAATDTITMLIITPGALFFYAAAGRAEYITVITVMLGVIIGNHIGALLPGELNQTHARLVFSSLLAVVALTITLGISSPFIPRVILTVSGLTLGFSP